MLTFDIAGSQINGAREYQEDAFLITRLSDPDGQRSASLVIVADGMGGHAAGNVASNMAVQSFNKFLTARFPSDALSSVLREAVFEANSSIAETIRETAALQGMGCTLVCAVIEDKALRWISVGDSHLYLLRQGELRKLNADHSYGGFLARLGQDGRPAKAQSGFSHNMLMSAMTGEEIAEIDCPDDDFELLTGDRLLVASDGLDSLSHAELVKYLGGSDNARQAVDALLLSVNEAGVPRQDNTTVIAMLVGEKPDELPRPDFSAARLQSIQEGQPQPPKATPIAVETPPASGLVPPMKVLLPLLLIAAGVAGLWGWKQQMSARMDNAGQTAQTGARTADSAPATPEVPTAEPVKTPKAAPPFRDGGGPLMVRLPGGDFLMGSPESAANFNERPQHRVSLKSFSISVHEVTASDFARFRSPNALRTQAETGVDRSRYPVTFVSWEDARAYAQWLSRQTGKRYRLPTEAEWEFAARGGNDTTYWWGRTLDKGKAHCLTCGNELDPRHPTTVARFAANAYGLHDTAGNVAEWVQDCYVDNYKNAAADGRAVEVPGCTRRVVRGGSFSSGPHALSTTARDALGSMTANDSVGFRVVRED
ncbi:MAG: hypothetical protein FJ164_10770 [Gammaproteobacteria bacterium]|nr:hypothetical protein [Gammaproteobacteria bacterium]